MRLRVALSALLWLAGCASPPHKPPAQKTAGSQASLRPPIKSGAVTSHDQREPTAPGSRMIVGTGPPEGCKLIRYVRAAYPEELKKKRIQGIVSLRVTIAKTGEIRQIDVLKGDPLLVPAALAAVRQWRYSPCLLNSQPIEVITNELIQFTLTQ
jgi:TonB family protein